MGIVSYRAVKLVQLDHQDSHTQAAKLSVYPVEPLKLLNLLPKKYTLNLILMVQMKLTPYL